MGVANGRNERLERMGLLPVDLGRDGGGVPPIVVVNRLLYNDAGRTVGSKVLDDRILVCGLYPPAVQERSIREALSLLYA